ncbi:MAG: hypothetical protein V7666_06720 [Sulfitobacter sp.]|uniref:hypothetical protein n=1 Tax=Sulfitobacter sp. TaxID=1903071 RepID=UPI0030039D10
MSVKKGKAVVDGLNRMPQAPFRQFNLFPRCAKIGHYPLVFKTDTFDLRPRLGDFVMYALGVLIKFSLGGTKLRLLSFKPCFRLFAAAAFLHKPI